MLNVKFGDIINLSKSSLYSSLPQVAVPKDNHVYVIGHEIQVFTVLRGAYLILNLLSKRKAQAFSIGSATTMALPLERLRSSPSTAQTILRNTQLLT